MKGAENMETLINTDVDETAIQAFRAGVRGALLRPGDDGYDAARRVWNGMIDRNPALIVRCAGVADVINAVNFARTHHLLVSVRGGGHNVTGNAVCEGGLMIDLSSMKGIRVDPVRRTVRAQAGLTWGEFDHETQAFGLAMTGGQVSTTGIAGLTLGGGLGWLMRTCGLVVDNLLSVDLVTADGRVLLASATENEDLFWGVRGGGGNFGIATSFEYRLYPIGPIVMGGMVLHPASQAKELLRYYREYMTGAPDELMALVGFLTAPPAPFVPTHLHGTSMVAIAVCYAGSIEEGQRAVEPLRAFGPPTLDLISPMPYAALQQLFDAAVPFGLHQVYEKSDHLAGLSDEVIDTFVTHTAAVTSPLSVVLLLPLGGAVSRVGEQDTAFGHRDTTYDYEIICMWTDPGESEQHIKWARDFWTAMQPFSVGVYVNQLGNEGEDRIRAAYPPTTYERLVALKNKYDPTNLFRMNQNIKPTA
jgi:FAD/FMN-containing dehydrogenase